MLARPESAFLVIADISGYTNYLAGTELDHAQDILADLMTTVIDALRPGLRVAKLEGDAVFAFALAERIDGSQLLDTVDRTYFSFQRRLRDIAQATACECNACTLMPRLDLKLIAHHGSIVRHRIAGHEELVGSDVIVAHRLLKNHVVERLKIPAYALFSGPCVLAMGIDPVAVGMTEYRDAYDDLGEVAGWVEDLGAARTADVERRRLVVADRDAGYIFEGTLPAPRDLVWSFMTDPSIRPRWQANVSAVEEQSGNPRRGIGTVNHCMHGKDVLVEEILDWRPVDYYTVRTTLPDGFKAVNTFAFEDAAEGTRIRILFTWGRNRREREEIAAARDFIGGLVERGQTNLRALLDGEMSRRAAEAAAAPPEPTPPASLGREISDPIRRQAAR